MILGQAESQSWWRFSLPQLLCTVTTQEKEPFLKKKKGLLFPLAHELQCQPCTFF